MFVYLRIHDTIRYTIWKNQKSIHHTIHVLITMSRSSNKDMTSIILDRMAENNTYG